MALNELSLCAGCLIAFLAGWLLNGHWRWMVGAPVPLALTLSAGPSA